MTSKMNNKRILTVGVFDLLHKGHVELFRRARSLGDYLIVAVQEDSSVLKFKPNANLQWNTSDRCYMVGAVRYVDAVVTYNDIGDFPDSCDENVNQIDFDIFVKGPDQNHSGFKKFESWCLLNGKKVIVLPRTEGVSSSQIKERIQGQ